MPKQIKPVADRMLALYGSGLHGHAHFAPSSSSGWLNCAGYLLANAVLGDTAGADAAYGSVAHDIAERWRIIGFRPDSMAGVTITHGAHDVLVDRDMLDHIQTFIEWCDEIEGDAYVEQKVDISPFTPIPGQRGTADHFVCAPGLLTITDLKMGTGVKVLVEKNPQAMLYALGAFNEWDWIYGFQRIVIRICQPRLGYFGVWSCSREELLAFGEYVKERAALAWQEDAPRTPGEKQCRFCRVSKTCPALAMHLDRLADDVFDAVEDAAYSHDDMQEYAEAASHNGVPVPSLKLAGMSDEALAYRLRFKKLYLKWFAEIENEVMARLVSGNDVAGWKIVAGKRSWQWTDQDKAYHILTDQGVPPAEIIIPVMVSTSAARKLLRKAKVRAKDIPSLLASVMAGVPGNSRLAPSDDSRQNSQEAVDDVFDEEEDDDL